MAIQKETTFSLKDLLFNKERVIFLADCLTQADPTFPKKQFVNKTVKGFAGKELKERMRWLTVMLEEFLPKDYKKAVAVMLRSLPKEAPESENFIFSGYTDYVAKHGCTAEHLQYSLEALGKFTAYFSAEFAIRNFLNTFPKETLDQMKKWAKSSQTSQRRLASEGTRPKLPWAPKISLDYTEPAPILNILYADKERYVTRSVANHLNDLSKLNADFALQSAKKWNQEQKQNPQELRYIIRHGLRTLIKQSHPQALELLGYKQKTAVEIHNFQLKAKQVVLGGYLEFSFSLVSQADEAIFLDYEVDYPGKDGRRSKKVFQLKQLKLQKGEDVHIKKRQKFAPMTTKKLYAGEHRVSIRVNGKSIQQFSFLLKIT